MSFKLFKSYLWHVYLIFTIHWYKFVIFFDIQSSVEVAYQAAMCVYGSTFILLYNMRKNLPKLKTDFSGPNPRSQAVRRSNYIFVITTVINFCHNIK